MTPPAVSAAAAADLARWTRPLNGREDLSPLLDRIGDARYVLIGDASHGTEEFYRWRARLTERLVTEKGFTDVGVEGDWPDCRRVHDAVIGAAAAPADPAAALARFSRWPRWMWANTAVADFARRLRLRNRTRPAAQRTGFAGLDVYSLWDSLRVVDRYLAEHRPAHRTAARAAMECFAPYAEDPQTYARAAPLVPDDCAEEVVTLLTVVRETADTGDRFDAEQNAAVVAGAEAHYRHLLRGGPAAWNVRDTHMADTVDRLVAARTRIDPSRPAKVVVWAHNTHVGDSQHTDMADAGMINLGHVLRARHGDDAVVLVGAAGYRGTVRAAPRWGAPDRVMTVPDARPGSLEELLHAAPIADRSLLVFPASNDRPAWLETVLDHRAIGVVYRPDRERWGNYVPTVLGRRYDALWWFTDTTAVNPLPPAER